MMNNLFACPIRERRWSGVMMTAALLAAMAMWPQSGCVSVKAPERIEINRHESTPVDPSRIPATSSHEEARHYLTGAYQRIQDLESENARLARKADEYKAERDRCREQTRSRDDD